jgi:hypothetical protein
MPGGESPKEAFSRKFNEVMSRGQATIDAMMAKRDGKDEDGQIIDALSKEGKVLQSQALQEKYPAGPPTQNISYQNAQGGATFIVNGPPPSDFNFKNAALINQYSD